MNPEAAQILATAIEKDIEAQNQFKHLEIGENWDTVYAEILPIEEDIDSPLYSLAFNFWDCWGDASNHDWLHHEPMKESQWPFYAQIIANCLRANKMPEDEHIIQQFLPAKRVSLFSKLKQWLSEDT